jgi:hypothetical protein
MLLSFEPWDHRATTIRNTKPATPTASNAAVIGFR